MAPATIDGDGQVRVPLDEHTRTIAEVAARAVLREHMETCPIVAEFKTMHADIYGVPGNKDVSPGLMGDVADLKHSRNLLRIGMRGAWVLITVLFGAVASALIGSK